MQRMNNVSFGRWVIYIDLEGFGSLYGQEDQVLLSLGQLMEGIFRIGTCCFPESPDRLFAHQLGDGFVIVSDFPEDTLERPIGVALALLRHVARSGRFAKAAVSEGQFADIRSCYPRAVLDAAVDGGSIALGHGVMTLFPVMGTALIRAFGVTKNCPSGPLLAVAGAARDRLPVGLRLHEVPEHDLIVIDWVHSESGLATSIAKEAGLNSPSPKDMSEMLTAYCKEQNITKQWAENVQMFLAG
jgi:hypothetical protein